MKLGVCGTEISASNQLGLIDEEFEQKPEVYTNWTHSCLPNFTDWALGDFVLFCPHQPDFFQERIQRWQGRIFAECDKIWTHVGVYVGDGEVIDSLVAGGVARRPIANWLNEGRVSVRYRPNLDDDSRDAMVNAAKDCSGRGYARVQAASAAIVNALPCSLSPCLIDKIDRNIMGGFIVHRSPSVVCWREITRELAILTRRCRFPPASPQVPFSNGER